MNAPCPLNAIRLKALPNRLVPVCEYGFTDEFVTSIRPGQGYLKGIPTENGWLLVLYPDKGLLGRPLEGRNSWKSAWEYNTVQLEVCTAESGWTAVEDWSLVESVTANR